MGTATALRVNSAGLLDFERHLDVVLLAAAIAVIPVILIEQSHAGPAWKTAAAVANWVIWLLFAGEAGLMLGFTPDRRGWASRHKLELAVVVLTPPVLPAALQSLRVFGCSGCCDWSWPSSSPAGSSPSRA
jgi:hypothetical protein